MPKKKLSDLSRAAHEARDQVRALDTAVFAAIAETPSPVLDRWMPRLSNAADRSKLWLALAALLYASGYGRARRGAARGLVNLGVTSFVVNLLLKRAWPRRRPALDLVPGHRLSRRVPTSSSFPSGHAASAAAFSAGVAAESAGLAVPMQTLAALVGFSRVATGAHYPSDVLAGFAIGGTIAAIGRRLVPPVPPPSTSQPRRVEQVTPRPDGEGVCLVVNPASNSGRGEAILRAVRRRLPKVTVVELGPDDSVAEVMRQAAAQAEVLAVAGGDGTVAAAAQAAIDRGIPLAVLPAGTFNHFARALGCYPLGRAIACIRRGTVGKVDVAYLNDKLFLNTASVGAYSDFVRIREGLEKRIGKPLAALVASWRTLSRERSVAVEVDGFTTESSLLFLGNSQYQPQGFAPTVRQSLDDGLLDLRILDVTTRASRAKVLGALLTGQLGRVREYHELSAPELRLRLPNGPERVARDGELGEWSDDLHVRVLRRGLSVYQPRESNE